MIERTGKQLPSLEYPERGRPRSVNVSDRGPCHRREFLRVSTTAGATGVCAMLACAAEADGSLPWRIGTGIADITPPLEVGILMSTGRRLWKPFEGVRLPLEARALVVQGADRRVAIVALDLLGLGDEAVGGMTQFKERVALAANRTVEPDAVILCSSHTHSAPESLACTDLMQTEPFQAWIGHLSRQIGSAIRRAGGAAHPCRLMIANKSAPGHTVNRRIRTTQGIRSFRVDMPREIVIGPEGPTDESVTVAAFVDRAGQPLALLVNAACHPVHEMCIPQVSSEYAGEMVRELDQRHSGCAAMFLNGAAGNLNPRVVSGGAGDAREHGRLLADVVGQSLGDLRPSLGRELRLVRRTIEVPQRDAAGQPLPKPLRTQIVCLRLGDVVFCFLPGEPFIETSLAIREASPAGRTIVVGYAEEWIGYIPTDRAFDNGGYETGPGSWSKVGRGSESVFRQAAIRAVRELVENKGR